MTPRDVKHGRYDTAAGAVLAAVFGVGALIAGAAVGAVIPPVFLGPPSQPS